MSRRIPISHFFTQLVEKRRVWSNGYNQFLCFFFGFLVMLVSGCKTISEVDQSPVLKDSREPFENLFHEAISEKMVGHFDKSISLFEQCLVMEPNNGAVNFALSELYKSQGNFPKALQAGKTAYESDNLNKWYALNLAQLYYSVGDYRNSATYFDIAIDEHEKNLELKYQFAEVLVISGQYENAIEVINDIEIETGRLPELTIAKYEMYKIMGEPEKGELEIVALLDENPTSSEVRVVLGNYYLGQELYDKAKLTGEDLIRIKPDHGEGYFLLADCELRLKNTQRAFDLYNTGFTKEDVTIDRKLELLWSLSSLPFEVNNPNAKIAEAGMEKLFAQMYDESLKNQTLHTYYGTFLLNQGNATDALEQFKIVCNLNASDFTFWNQLLFLEKELNSFADLYQDAQKAIELFPSQPIFYLHAGVGACQIGKYSEGEEFLFLGKDLVVNNPELLQDFYIELGRMSCLQKKYEQGYTYFEQGKKANLSGAKVYGIEAEFLFLESKIQQAEASIKIGLSINPYEPEVLYTQGIIYLSKKEYVLALQSLESAAVHANRNGRILEAYGDALFLTGQKDKAYQIWIEAQKHGNNSALLKKKIADKNYYEN